MNINNQLIFEFKSKKNFNIEDYFVSESNKYAYKIIKKWPRWTKKIVNIYGEKYSGKTHLANIFKKKANGFFINSDKINNDILKQFKLYETIIIDGFYNEVEEELLYTIFNLVEQDNKFLIIFSRIPISDFEFKLKDTESRAKNCLSVEIQAPDDELIFAIIMKSFSDRQITIDKKIINFILNRINRSYSKIHDFIYKIDELSLKKKKPINFKTIKEIL